MGQKQPEGCVSKPLKYQGGTMRPLPEELTLKQAQHYINSIGFKRGYALFKTRDEWMDAWDQARNVFGDLACGQMSLEDSHGSAKFKFCTVVHEPPGSLGKRLPHFSHQSVLGLILSRSTLRALADRDHARAFVAEQGLVVSQGLTAL